MKKILAILVILMLVTGCAGRRKSSPLDTYAGVDTAATVAQGAVGGAIVGGLLGAVGALLSGGDKDDIKKGAAIGAGVGVIAGTAYGSYIAKEKKRIYAERKSVSVQLREIRNENKQLETKTRELGKRISALKGKIAEYNQSNNKSREESKRLKGEIDAVNMEMETLDHEYITQMIKLQKCAEEEHEQRGGTSKNLAMRDSDFLRVLEHRKKNQEELAAFKVI